MSRESSSWRQESTLEAEDLLRSLGTRIEGLSSGEAAVRLKERGRNAIARGRPTPVYLRIIPHVTNLFAILLWVAGALAFIGGMPQLGYAVFAVIIVNGAFSFAQEYRAERAAQALRNMLPKTTIAFRDGKPARLNAEELVPGDIISLESGDSVAADVRLLESSSLLVNNSSLTGESEPAARTAARVDDEGQIVIEMPNLVFMGTSVVSGNCKAVVVRTGPDTEFGHVARLTQEVKEELSPLQKQIAGVSKFIAVLSVITGAAFFALGVTIGRSFFENFMFAIGIICANVPEGLLPTVTLALAMGMQRMAARHALVKKLTSVETLGCTTVILTDKTGTLTQNEMTVTRLFSEDSEAELGQAEASPVIDALLHGMVLTNNARLTSEGEGGVAGDGFVGDPTEAALLLAAKKKGVDVDRLLTRYPRVYEIPFDSRRKRMTTVHRMSGKVWALTKGAPVETVARCASRLADGKVVPMDEAARGRILASNDAMAGSGLRVLAFSRREMQSEEVLEQEEVEQGMTFVGLAGMFDPPRPEVAAAIRKARAAGIRVIMVTGDYGLTARSIARRVGIVTGGHPKIVTGAELLRMDDSALSETVKVNKEIIFARVSPEDKMKIARALQRNGEIVAVTGDGVNDAPALKSADIGVAMGRAGTDVAKEAADIVLTDDNFASIVAAVEEGRTVYQNIRKFITYILASNVPEVVPYIMYVVFRVPLPLTVMQILAVDVGTDLLPALALGVEKAEPGIMERPPRSQQERLLDKTVLLRAYPYLGLIEAVVSMAAFLWFLDRHGWTWGQPLDTTSLLYRQATSIVFCGIVVSQVFNVFAVRTDRASVFEVGVFSNRWILAGLAWELGIVTLLLNVPVLQRAFGTAPIGIREWLFLWSVAPILLVIEEGRKWFARQRTRRLVP